MPVQEQEVQGVSEAAETRPNHLSCPSTSSVAGGLQSIGLFLRLPSV